MSPKVIRKVARRLIWPALWLGVGIALAIGCNLGPWLDSLYTRTEGRLARRVAVVEPLGGWNLAPGATARVHATGVHAPTRILFHPRAGADSAATDPFYYVAELPGTIKIVRRDGTMATVADKLVSHPWSEGLEAGLMGIEIDRTGRTLFYSRTVWNAAAGVYESEVRRLALDESGTVATKDELLLPLREPTVPSYCVQFLKLDPRGESLFIGVGAGGLGAEVQSLDRFCGKVLRVTLDGLPHGENPFRCGEGSVRDYVYAFGFRNPIDLAWAPNGVGFVTDVGPGLDRLARLVRGRNYCYGAGDGDHAMRSNAAYTWGPGESWAPTGVGIRQEEAGNRLFVGLFGPVGVPGAKTGKAVQAVRIDAAGDLCGPVETVAAYRGPFFCAVSALAVGPDDAIYFADFYGLGDGPPRGNGRVIRLEFPPSQERAPVAAATTGEQAFQGAGCVACHDYGSSLSTKEGPSLADFGDRIRARLASREYGARLAEFAAADGEYFVRNRPMYAALRAASADTRPRLWFGYHLADPRFDHPESKMPSFAHLPKDQVDLLFGLLYR